MNFRAAFDVFENRKDCKELYVCLWDFKTEKDKGQRIDIKIMWK